MNLSKKGLAHFIMNFKIYFFQKLGWQPKCDIRVALDKISAWHRAYLNGEDMAQYSLNDIKMYAIDHSGN